jgi:hypothetical protein
MEAALEGVKAGSDPITAARLRVIPEFPELSSLSSRPDGFGNGVPRNSRVLTVLRRGTPLALVPSEVAR